MNIKLIFKEICYFFFSHIKKATRPKPSITAPDINRSISMPPDQHTLNQINNNVNRERRLTLNTIQANSKESGLSDEGEYSLTPTTDPMDPIFESRRASSGSLLGQDVVDKSTYLG